MRMLTFAKRCTKEILRDPINLAFGLGFPLVLLLLLSSLQKNIPAELFDIDTLTPGITVFGLSFMTLFSATLIAKDRVAGHNPAAALYTAESYYQRLFKRYLKCGQRVLAWARYRNGYLKMGYYHLRGRNAGAGKH